MNLQFLKSRRPHGKMVTTQNSFLKQVVMCNQSTQTDKGPLLGRYLLGTWPHQLGKLKVVPCEQYNNRLHLCEAVSRGKNGTLLL